MSGNGSATVETDWGLNVIYRVKNCLGYTTVYFSFELNVVRQRYRPLKSGDLAT
jgi:hypothetical protein